MTAQRIWQGVIAVCTFVIVLNAYYLVNDRTPVEWGWGFITGAVLLILLALHQITRRWEDS